MELSAAWGHCSAPSATRELEVMQFQIGVCLGLQRDSQPAGSPTVGPAASWGTYLSWSVL